MVHIYYYLTRHVQCLNLVAFKCYYRTLIGSLKNLAKSDFVSKFWSKPPGYTVIYSPNPQIHALNVYIYLSSNS